MFRKDAERGNSGWGRGDGVPGMKSPFAQPKGKSVATSPRAVPLQKACLGEVPGTNSPTMDVWGGKPQPGMKEFPQIGCLRNNWDRREQSESKVSPPRLPPHGALERLSYFLLLSPFSTFSPGGFSSMLGPNQKGIWEVGPQLPCWGRTSPGCLLS